VENRKPPIWLVPVALLALGAPVLLLGRTGGPAAPAAPPTTLAAPATLAPPAGGTSAAPPTSSAPPGVPQALIDRAMAELRAGADRPAGGVTLAAAQAVNWPDASLGCPERGKSYIQVITPGYRIVLQAGAQQYEFHSGADAGSRLARCSGTGAPPPVP